MTWSARGDSHAGDSFTVSVPPTSGGVGVTLNNAFEPTFSEVRLAKQLDFRGADGQPVSPTVLKALTSTPPRFTVDYQCVRNGAVVTTGVTAVSETESPSLQVPTGATCTFTERPSIIPGTTGPEITYTGGDQTSDGSTSVDLVIPGELRDLVVTNTYDVQYGSFNLKKKVDGEGVATVAPERQYELRYRCTLNEVEVASGTQLMGRFDSGDSNQVTGIPTGAECSVVETPSDEYGAEEPHAQWTARWTVADGPTGFENEQVCANQEGCETTPRRNEVTVTIPTTGEDNFLGTLVVREHLTSTTRCPCLWTRCWPETGRRWQAMTISPSPWFALTPPSLTPVWVSCRTCRIPPSGPPSPSPALAGRTVCWRYLSGTSVTSSNNR